jgi:hypothetical protein|tara:strand:+ start:495 stop:920 length:426 start_codon:yes stop_codon:yes gene_type:complete
MRKLFILTFSITTLLITSISFAQDLNPTLSIRYEDFIENLTPGVAIGLKLNIDGDRYTGWEVTTDQDNFDTRLIMGWKWGIIGIGALTDGNGDVYPHYTFGVSYEVLPGLSSNIEYVMTPDAPADDDTLNDHLRLALSISF